jgi:hypothetical protein
VVVAGKQKVGSRMPLILRVPVSHPGGGATGSGILIQPLDANSAIAVADDAAQHPVQGADDEDSSLLCTGEVPEDDVDEGNGSQKHPCGEPREDPPMNPQMNVHGVSFSLNETGGGTELLLPARLYNGSDLKVAGGGRWCWRIVGKARRALAVASLVEVPAIVRWSGIVRRALSSMVRAADS